MHGHVFGSSGVAFVRARKWWWWQCVVVMVATEANFIGLAQGAATADFRHVGRGSIDAVRALIERVLLPGAPASNPAFRNDTMTPTM